LDKASITYEKFVTAFKEEAKSWKKEKKRKLDDI